ncbi:hypothetical protein Q4E40_02690 [Pontibacter sp. BT731]|uniref:hypothetical protein n=1 Tax=Pontibacter coccineus TaxID=3063328 RepID=UPI0026E1B6E3|nr:hypothetical protein [Pontibacter sp. BT731]MDO6389020.1 hypothetical protein [Pontibacter sp. BT731]
MTEKEFCKAHNGYFGEEIDRVGQLTYISFTGEELMEYVEHHIRQANGRKDWKPSTIALMEGYGDNPDDFPYTGI